MMKKIMIGLFALAFLASAGIVSAQGAGNILSKAADKSIALRILNGYDSTLTIVVTGNGTNFAVTAGANANTIDGNVKTTITLLADAFAA